MFELTSVATALAGCGPTMLLQSTVLLLVGLTVGRMAQRCGPAVQSGIYRTTLMGVLICPLVSSLLSVAGLEGLSIRMAPTATESETAPILTQSDSLTPDPPFPDGGIFSGAGKSPPPEPTSTGPPLQTEQVSAMPPIPEAPPASTSVHRDATLTAVASGLAGWLFGCSLLTIRLWIGHRRMVRVKATASAADPDVRALCAELASRMDVGAPEVLRSPYLFSPCLDGIRRPAILLPADGDEDLHDTFVHELAHLARRDGLWNGLRRISTALVWMQPLLWYLSRRLEVTAEEVCDDYVVELGGDRARYAGHLLELAGRTLPPAALAGVGMIALRSMLAGRIVRILDSSRHLSTRLGARALAVMLAAGLASTLLAGLLGVGEGRRKALAGSESEQGVATESDDSDDGMIRGRVVGPDGKPVPGAKVVGSRFRAVLNGVGDDSKSEQESRSVQTTSGPEGRFEIAFPPPEPEGEISASRRRPQVLATAPGFGLGYFLYQADRTIRLSEGDVPITGRLVDLEGRPAAGVTVRVDQVYLPQGRAAVEKLDSMAGRLILNAEPLWPGGIATDADGRFRIEGLGRDVLVTLSILGPSVARKQVQVLTRAMKPYSKATRDADLAGLDEPVIHGADCTIPVAPTRPIEGFVRDADSSAPIAGAVVSAEALSGSTLNIVGSITTTTDAHGHYRLVGLPKEGTRGHMLSVYPPLDQPYFVTGRRETPASPGLDPVKLDIALKRGIWITGRVVDVATGKPVRTAIDYFPLLSNAHAREYPNFNPNITASIGIKTRYKTDREGKFRIVGLHGGGVVTAHTEDKSYRTGVGAEAIQGMTGQDQLLTYDRIFPQLYQGLKELSVPEGVDSYSCDLGLDAGGSIQLRLVDESGAPVKHAIIWGRYPTNADHGDHNLYDESTARIGGLVKGSPRTILVQHRARKIGATLKVLAEDAKPGAERTVTLRPTATVTGRLADAAGKPMSGGVRIELLTSSSDFFQRVPAGGGELDSEGRFRCDGLPEGGPYEVVAMNQMSYGFGARMEEEAFKPFPLSKDLQVEAGRTLDLGTFDVESQRRLAGPAHESRGPADVPITGRIIDMEGRPVAGVLVKLEGYRCPKSNRLDSWLEAVRQGSPPWVAANLIDWDRKTPEKAQKEATTDRDGRFRLDGIGGERNVELSVRGDTIAYKQIDVVTRPMTPMPAPGFGNQYGPGTGTIYGADFTYTAAPSRPIEGVVKDAGTGEPLEGVEIRSTMFAGSDWIGTMALRVKTDARGRFRLLGMPKGKNVLLAVPKDQQPYFLHRVEVPDAPGAGPVRVDVGLNRGLWIEGKITEQATGKPVPGARLFYIPFLENTFAQATPEFGKDQNTDGTEYQDRYLSRADGSFRLVGLPGRAIVGADVVDKEYMTGVGSESIRGMEEHGHFKTYSNPVRPGKNWPTVMKEIEPPADARIVHVDLQPRSGDLVRFRIVDVDGKPVSGAKTLGRTSRGSYDREPLKSDEGEVTNLYSDEERTVAFVEEGRKTGMAIRVRKGIDRNAPVIVRLEPLASISGRVVDADGTPVSGATVRPDLLPEGSFSLHLAEVSCDRDGRFLVPDVPTGCDYALAVESRDEIKRRRFAFREKVSVQPGKTTDAGEIRFKRN
jgi:beta-lactamase regulating signal transducer with metallopeptidase domain/protocatechuate 3,4-dioxygenase beta subunit